MKKKIIYLTLISFLAAGVSLCGYNFSAQAATVSETASVALGQPNTTSTAAAATGASTTTDPRGLSVCGTKLFIADRSNNRVLIYNSIPAASGANADLVIGQTDSTGSSENQGQASPSANTLYHPSAVHCDGTKIFIADQGNNRVLIYNSIPTSNNASADVVVGQVDMTTNVQYSSFSVTANNLGGPNSVYSDGTKLFVSDFYRSRVLIYNSIPTSNNASADVVVGQADMNASSQNRSGSATANTLSDPSGVSSDGTKLFIADLYNNRVLIYNSIPSSNGANADVVVGQPNMTERSANQNGSVAGNSLNYPAGVFSNGSKLFISDTENDRVLIFNSIPGSDNVSADEVVGRANLTGGSSGSLSSTLYQPMGLYFDGTKLFVADSGYNRILIFGSPSSGDTSDPSNPSDSASPSASQNVTTDKTTLPYSNKKITRKINFTFNDLNLGKAKKSWVSIRLNGRKVKPIRVTSAGTTTRVTVSMKYKKWPRATYNLTMSYKKKVNKAWERGNRSQEAILSIY